MSEGEPRNAPRQFAGPSHSGGAVFSDAETVRRALKFEAALARAEAEVGLVAGDVADRICRACEDLHPDPGEVLEEAAFTGTLALAVAPRIRAVLDAPAAQCVHMGATSQDLADTVLMTQCQDAAVEVRRDLARVVSAAQHLAALHLDTPVLARTLLQPAMPIAFGLRAAQWSRQAADVADRLGREMASASCVQFGGAVGAWHGLRGRGEAVMRGLSRRMGLTPAAPWHARRDRISALAAALAILIGALGKIARDIALMGQVEVGEAREASIAGRGGSSAMPGKRNPIGCQVVLSAAAQAPGLLCSILAGLPQELERGLGGWQAERPVLVALFELATDSARAMASVLEGLEVDPDAMARNLAASGTGADLAESRVLAERLLASGGDL